MQNCQSLRSGLRSYSIYRRAATRAGKIGQALLAGLVLCFCLALQAESRSQWEIQHPDLSAGEDGTYVPGQMPGQLHKGLPPQLSKNFWQGQNAGTGNVVQPGVVLTGILDKDLSSASNKPGDIFAINLTEGYVQNGMQVIPRDSKIVGAVTSVTPAKLQRTGQPGNIQVSLQSLVLPDGTHVPFFGFIATNPNHAYKKAPQKRNLGFDMRDAGSALTGMLSPYTSRVGIMAARKYRGNDFCLDKGEPLPVRLNQQLVIPEQEVKPAQAMPVPGTGTSSVPGLTGPDPVGQYRAPLPAQNVPGLDGQSDPFNTPINPGTQVKPLSDMPEPF